MKEEDTDEEAKNTSSGTDLELTVSLITHFQSYSLDFKIVLNELMLISKAIERSILAEQQPAHSLTVRKKMSSLGFKRALVKFKQYYGDL